MLKGISTCDNVAKVARCLKDSRVDFVFRYYSLSDWKRMYEPEAIALVTAGLQLAVVYEDGPRSGYEDGYFTAPRGVRHGRNAYQWASDVIHQPNGSAIYFAVDHDYTDRQNLDGIKAYFESVRDTIAEESANNGALDYKIGVYGSGKICRMIKEDLSLAEYSWLAESTGWNGYSVYKDVCNVLQAISTTSVCHLENYEDCTASGGFGDFTLAIETLHPSLLRMAQINAGPKRQTTRGAASSRTARKAKRRKFTYRQRRRSLRRVSRNS